MRSPRCGSSDRERMPNVVDVLVEQIVAVEHG